VGLQVLAFFTQCDIRNDNHDDEGAGPALDYVANGLCAEDISENHVRVAVEFLASEGRLYFTIDDNHFKSTA
jgi:hypothetical protein